MAEPHSPSIALPRFASAWITELLGGSIPDESKATCSDCAMCRPPERTVTPHEKAFRPDVKCCSFMPRLPNFLVGGVLADMSAEAARGRESVEERINAAVGATPLGVDASATYNVLYASSKNVAFGLSRSLRCPHYIDESGGLCGIWRYRNSVCSTFYCKFVRGEIGRDFWNRMHQLLAAIEDDVARWCIESLDVGNDALAHLLGVDFKQTPQGSRLTAAVLDGIPEPIRYRRLWGNWAGRERDFYVASARLVESLSWNDVEVIGGVRLRLYSRLTCQAYRRLMSDDVPRQLQCGDFTVALAHDGFVRLLAYSPQDQLVMPRAILDVLPLFDGHKTTDDVLAEAQRIGVRMGLGFIRQLVDSAVLVPSIADPARVDSPSSDERESAASELL